MSNVVYDSYAKRLIYPTYDPVESCRITPGPRVQPVVPGLFGPDYLDETYLRAEHHRVYYAESKLAPGYEDAKMYFRSFGIEDFTIAFDIKSGSLGHTLGSSFRVDGSPAMHGFISYLYKHSASHPNFIALHREIDRKSGYLLAMALMLGYPPASKREPGRPPSPFRGRTTEPSAASRPTFFGYNSWEPIIENHACLLIEHTFNADCVSTLAISATTGWDEALKGLLQQESGIKAVKALSDHMCLRAGYIIGGYVNYLKQQESADNDEDARVDRDNYDRAQQ